MKHLFEHGDIRNICRFKKSNEKIKDRVLRDFRNLLEHDEEEGEENCQKPIIVSNLWGNNFFYQGFLSRRMSIHRAAREGSGPSFIPL